MLKVVLDTNVIVSALIKPGSPPELIFNMTKRGLFLLCLTEEIFEEYRGVLARPKFKALNQKYVKQLLSSLREKPSG